MNVHAGIRLAPESDNIWHFDPYHCHSFDVTRVKAVAFSTFDLAFVLLRGPLHARKDALHCRHEARRRVEAKVAAVLCFGMHVMHFLLLDFDGCICIRYSTMTPIYYECCYAKS